MHYLLRYDLVDDYVERREAFRAEHLRAAREAVVRGELVLAGALSDPMDNAVLLFQGTSPKAAEDFARNDPYVRNGLVRSWRVQPWRTVVGTDASVRLPGDGLSAPDEAPSRDALIGFMRGARHWVVSSIGPEGPQSAVVGVAVTERLELVFDTLGSTRKASNLRRDPRASLVVWRGDATAQIEGIGDEPTGAELERVREAYFATFPDGRERATWEGITYFRVRPTWIRTSEFGESGPRVRELAGDTLAALLR